MDPLRNLPLALIVVDGWGIAPDGDGNCIRRAHTPNYDSIASLYPMTELVASGEAVGLPAGSAASSEAGHLNIGTGRAAKTDSRRIADSIADGSFFENAVLREGLRKAKEANSRVHLIGLLSDAGVHSSPESLFALLRMAKRNEVSDVLVHGILDGVDVPARTADIYAEAIEIKIADIGVGRLATLCGRHYAMDSGENWERTARAYTLLVHKEGEHCTDARTAIRSAYLRGISDEYIAPIVLDGGDAVIKDGDVVIFFNHRPDSMRQLVRSLAMPDAGGIAKPKAHFVGLTQYDGSFRLDTAFPPESNQNCLADRLAEAGLHFYRVSESISRPLVTSAFDGGDHAQRPNEKTIVAEPPDSRRLYPEMRNFKIADAVIRTLESDPTAIVFASFASPGKVAETGDAGSVIEATQYFDTCLGGILKKIESMGGSAIITSSNGNCESVLNADGSPNRSSTHNPVPFHFVGREARRVSLRADGVLSDIAPTTLALLGIAVPPEMTGQSLIQ